MMRSINEKVHDLGYTMILGSSEEDLQREKEVLRVFTSKKVSGILIVPCSYKNARYIEQLQDSGIAVVQLNRKLDRLEADSVVSDTLRAIHNATVQMVKTRNKKRVMLMGYNPGVIADLNKRAGYLSAAEECGMEPLVMETTEHDPDELARIFSEFSSARGVDGVICTTRTNMEVALQSLKDRGIRIPEDVSVTGYDDPIWTRLVDPKITVISEDRYMMGDQAVNLLFDRIEGRYTGEPKHILMDAELIIRES
jgi:DNA-binding LacI/PurR family transcriptional regulator